MVRAIGVQLWWHWWIGGMLLCNGQPLLAVEKDAAALSQKRQEAWRNHLNYQEFELPDFNDEPIGSLSQLPAKVETHIILSAKRPGALEFQFFRDGQKLIVLRGHAKSAFASEGNTLFFADYAPDMAGCTVKAFDLTSGQEKWKTTLHQAQPMGHSGYGNVVYLWTSSGGQPKGEVEGSALIVTGSESYCDYIEVLDAATGKSLAIKNYRVGFGGKASKKPDVE